MVQIKEVEDFVTEKGGFVNPEKMEAVELYGLKKAKEMWANGEPDFTTRMELSKRSISRYLSGDMFRSIGSTIFKE